MLIQSLFGKGISAIFAKLVLGLCLTTNLMAADGMVDPYFQTGRGVNGGVQSVALQADGKVLIGGWFTQINGYLSNRIARLNTDGSLDTSFNTGTGANAEVRAVALQPDGKVLIVGLFTSFNGITRNRIARLNSDGSLDASFNAGEITASSLPVVMAIALQPDGKILVGGYFNSIGGVSLKNIARLNSDGSIDTTFNIGIGINSTPVETIASVSEIVVQLDGKVLIGGQFSSYNSSSSKRIVRINEDGTFDSSFSVGAGANNQIEAVTVQPDGRILLGGDFTSFNGTNRNRIARINSDGSLDTSFNPGSGADATVYKITVQPDGKILVGGIFQSFQGNGGQRLTRLQSDGAFDASFNHQNTITGQVVDIVVQPDGKILVGGWFVGSWWENRPNRITRLDANGGIDISFLIKGVLGAGGPVIFVLQDGKILAGNKRLHPDGTLDKAFNTNPDMIFRALQADGKILVSVISAQVNGRWQVKVARLNWDGTIDTSFNPGAAESGFSSSTAVSAITVQPDGKILIGGDFTIVNGVSRRYIARLNSDGSLDPAFNAGEVTGESTGHIMAITLQPNGKILVGGYFGSIGGVPSSGIARLSSDGSVDSTFKPGTGASRGVIGGVHAVQTQPDGKIIISGYFTTYNGVARNKIARINPDGSLDTSFTPNIEGDADTVHNFLIQRDGKIVIVGDFDHINGIYRNCVARLNADGSLDPTFVSGTGIDRVYAIAQQSDGKLLISGSFSSVGGFERFGLARLLNRQKISFADFDGDGKSDISVYRPSNGTWYFQQSSAGFTAANFGSEGDKLVPADFDGDGKTDMAVYRNGTWYLQRSTAGFTGIAFGQSNDIPAPADFDGDGRAEIAVFRPSNGTWYIYNPVTNQFTAFQFGQAGDIPVAADYDGDGKVDVAVYRNGTWYLQRTQLGFTGIQFGQNGDKPVVADYDGDGKADVAVFRPSNGTWYLQRSQLGFTGIQFGLGTDKPVPADYDGDAKADIAVFRDGTWYIQRSTSGFTGIAFGATDDKPIPNAFVP